MSQGSDLISIIHHHIYCVLSFVLRDGCSIELTDTVVVTGGLATESALTPIATVQVYDINGPVQTLPTLITARWSHACAHFRSSLGQDVSKICT